MRAEKNIPTREFHPLVPHTEASQSPKPALEIRHVLWGRHLWSIRQVQHNRPITVGEQDALILLPPGLLPVPTLELITQEEGRWQVRVWPGLQGVLLDAQGERPLADVLTEKPPGENLSYSSGWLSLRPGQVLRLDFGPAQLVLRLVDPEPVPRIQLRHLVDAPLVAMLLCLFSLFGALQAYLHSLPAPEVADLLDSPDRFLRIVLAEPVKEVHPAPLVTPTANRRHQPVSKAKAAGVEGKIGSKTAKPDQAQGSARRAQDEKVANHAGILGILEQGLENADLLFGGGTLGAGLKKSLGLLEGIRGLDQRGAEGLGLRNAGLGGGGESLGIDGLPLWGKWHGYGPSGLLALGEPKKAAKRSQVVELGKQAAIIGTVDKSMIRRVMQRHHNQFRHCYQRELSRNPKLYGKITVQFLINPKGHVSQSRVAVSSLRNQAVEACVAQVVRRIVFPPPRQLVAVRYPFLFSSVGP